jgi:hypothetical protein
VSRIERKKRPFAVLLATCAVAALSLFLSASPARADTLEACQQQLLSGSLDINGYLACIAAVNASQSSGVTPVAATGNLPITGNNTGRLVGLGGALIVLGGAARYGSVRARRMAATADAGTPTE